MLFLVLVVLNNMFEIVYFIDIFTRDMGELLSRLSNLTLIVQVWNISTNWNFLPLNNPPPLPKAGESSAKKTEN